MLYGSVSAQSGLPSPGSFFLGESASFARLAFLALILIGIVGLRIAEIDPS
jgi:multidrug transporter EmrE-like cation transporter